MLLLELWEKSKLICKTQVDVGKDRVSRIGTYARTVELLFLLQLPGTLRGPEMFQSASHSPPFLPGVASPIFCPANSHSSISPISYFLWGPMACILLYELVQQSLYLLQHLSHFFVICLFTWPTAPLNHDFFFLTTGAILFNKHTE